ncbi:MAG: SagB/ThcOx family dehydrogenase [Methanothrix sp.]|nr:SagB/ThcOx family dehydrogenase [Methanothrix sp.]
MSEDFDQVIAYHLRTKHHPRALAPGPAGLDWSNQPDPFRSYEAAPQIRLIRQGFISAAKGAGNEGPSEDIIRPSPLNLMSLSQLFFESLALSGQKSVSSARWYLRVNPSSGNLHPTEAYLISGPIAASPHGLLPAGLYHYAPKSHALELLARIKEESWRDLELPKGTMLLALTSISWRESWKYGERAFRYSMIDLGHALAAVGVAARCLGWRALLEDDLGTDDLTKLLGLEEHSQLSRYEGEEEHADLLLAIHTDGSKPLSLHSSDLSKLKLEREPVRANVLSLGHAPWALIDQVSDASKKPSTNTIYSALNSASSSLPGSCKIYTVLNTDMNNDLAARYCQLLRKRRSAQIMDGMSSMPAHSFLSILRAVMPKSSPLDLLPWKPCIHPVFFVHRVEGLEKGLYILLRDGGQKEVLKEAMLEDFVWERSSGAPPDIELYLLAQGDSRLAAKETSCRQDIASDGCFAAAMLAAFNGPLQKYGSWFYRRLFWECGVIGQAFYLAGEAAGYQGCGIGCFFDDMVHHMLGLSGYEYQDLYHFTVGRALVDPRLTDLPAYD